MKRIPVWPRGCVLPILARVGGSFLTCRLNPTGQPQCSLSCSSQGAYYMPTGLSCKGVFLGAAPRRPTPIPVPLSPPRTPPLTSLHAGRLLPLCRSAVTHLEHGCHFCQLRELDPPHPRRHRLHQVGPELRHVLLGVRGGGAAAVRPAVDVEQMCRQPGLPSPRRECKTTDCAPNAACCAALPGSRALGRRYKDIRPDTVTPPLKQSARRTHHDAYPTRKHGAQLVPLLACRTPSCTGAAAQPHSTYWLPCNMLLCTSMCISAHVSSAILHSSSTLATRRAASLTAARADTSSGRSCRRAQGRR